MWKSASSNDQSPAFAGAVFQVRRLAWSSQKPSGSCEARALRSASSAGPIRAWKSSWTGWTVPVIWIPSEAAAHVDDEAVADVVLEQSLIGLVDLVHGDELDLGVDVLLGAEIEHFLGFRNAADGRAADGAVPPDEVGAD